MILDSLNRLFHDEISDSPQVSKQDQDIKKYQTKTLGTIRFNAEGFKKGSGSVFVLFLSYQAQ